ncbi:hypothetical protein [Streptosporangium sp. CA-115845]|uniref:hypothetical protein n=1 Tax=Streptosporangium sp. CA-115845 TaxID=3240071 RepID=UPI003D94F8B3
MEAVVLCDLLADGTAVLVLVEPIYDTNTGDRVGTRLVDPVTGDPYTPVGTLGPCAADGCNASTTSQLLCDDNGPFARATTHDCTGAVLGVLDRTLDGQPYTVTGTVGVCPTSPDCESPTTPTATVGLCLADGTPIAVTVIRDCEGAVTSEGWINLQTGAYSAGAPPVGTVACGSSQSVQVSGTFCDVLADGTVAGLVLIEYSYAADGTIAGVRLVDATTGATYTPTGTVTTCPAGVEQPERDLVQLCDTAADGTVTEFIRDYARDENGQITGHTDYALNGTPYTLAGTVGACDVEPCRDTSSTLLCDTTTTESVTVFDPANVTGPDGWQVVSFTGNQPGYGPTGAMPYDVYRGTNNAGQVSYGARPDLNAGPNSIPWPGYDNAPVRWIIRKTFTAPEDGTATLTAVGFRADGGGRVRINGVDMGLYSQWGQPGVGGGGQAPVTAGPNVIELEVRDDWGFNWVTGRLNIVMTRTVQFMRRQTVDCETGAVVSQTDTTLDGDPYTVTGEVGQCEPLAECCPPPPWRDAETLTLCDTAADGTVTEFLRTLIYSDSGPTVTVDTALDGITPYASAGTVGRCCDTTVLGECTYSLPDTPTGFALADPAYPGCWVGTAGAPSYAYGDRVTSWAATYQSDSNTSSVVLFNSPDLGGAINFTAFTPALPVNPAQSAAAYTGTAVISGVTVTLTATGGNGLGIWQANNTGLYINPGDAFRLDFSKPVRLTVNTSGFADPPSLHERLCDVTVKTVPWPALRLADCQGVITTVDPDTREPIPAGAVLDCQAPGGVACATAAVQTIRLCDLDPTVEADEDGRRCAVPFLRHLAYDCAGELSSFHDTSLDGTTPYTPVQVVDCQCESGEGLTSTIEVPWQVVSVVEDPAGLPRQDFIYTVSPENDPARIGTIRVHVSRAAGAPCSAYNINNLVFSNTSAYTLTLDAVAQEMSYLRVDLADFDTFEPVAINTTYPLPTRLGGTAGWNAAHTRIVPSENDGTGYMYWDNPPAQVGWSVLNQGGGVSCSALSFQGMTVEPGGCCGGESSTPCGDTEIAQLCDLVAAPATPLPVPADSFTLTGNVQVIGDTLQFSRNNVPPNGVAQRAVTGLISGAASELLFDAGWGGGGNPPATNDAIYRAEVLDGATVLATSTVNLSNGSGSAGAVVAQPPLAFTAPPSGTVTVRFTDLSTGGALNRDLVIRPLTVETEGVELTAIPFLRAYTYDCTGLLLTTADTELDGSTTYTPQGQVGVCSGTSGTTTATEPSPVNTGVRAVTGTAAQDLAAEFTGLQSVSLAVLAGAVNATMSDGSAVPIPAGVTLTWSVSKDTDTALAAASFAGANPSAFYLLNWTYLS